MRRLALALLLFPSSVASAQTLTRAPELTHFVEAEYPAELRETGPETVSVTLELTIDDTGHVSDATVSDGAGEPFDSLVLAAVGAFEFTPAEIDGVVSPIRIAYRYEL